MLVERYHPNNGSNIVVSSCQVLVVKPQDSFLLCTLRQLTNGAQFENPLSSNLVRGPGWAGKLAPRRPIVLPGPVYPAVRVVPQAIGGDIHTRCIKVIVGPTGGVTVQVPDGFNALWEVTGGPDDHGYSLAPVNMLISQCCVATYTAQATGAVATSTDEGQVAIYPGRQGIDRYGVIVDVDDGTLTGYAVPLRLLI